MQILSAQKLQLEKKQQDCISKTSNWNKNANIFVEQLLFLKKYKYCLCKTSNWKKKCKYLCATATFSFGQCIFSVQQLLFSFGQCIFSVQQLLFSSGQCIFSAQQLFFSSGQCIFSVQQLLFYLIIRQRTISVESAASVNLVLPSIHADCPSEKTIAYVTRLIWGVNPLSLYYGCLPM